MANTFNVTLVTTNFTATIAAPPSPVTVGIGTYTVRVSPSPQVVVTATNTYQNIQIVDTGIINILSPSSGTVDEFNGDGATTTFRLTKALPTSGDFLEVIVGGVVQTPGLSYTTSTVNTIYTSTTDILFTQAPPTGTKNVVARYYSILVAEQIAGPQGIQGIQGVQGPSQGAQGTQGTQGIQGATGGVTSIINGGGLKLSPANGLGNVTVTNNLGTVGASKQVNIVGTLTNLASSQAANTIILNATNGIINGVSGQTDSTYVAPVRYVSVSSTLPTSYIPFDGGSFDDVAGNLQLQSNNGGVTITSSLTKFNHPSANFTGSQQQGLTYSGYVLNINNAGSWCSDFWIYPTADSVNGNLISFKNGSNYFEWQWMYSGAGSGNTFGIYWNNAFYQPIGTSEPGINLNAWNHIFIQYVNGQLYFGVNGTMFHASGTYPFSIQSPLYICSSPRFNSPPTANITLFRFFNTAQWPTSGTTYTTPVSGSYQITGAPPNGFYNMAYNPTTAEIIYWS